MAEFLPNAVDATGREVAPDTPAPFLGRLAADVLASRLFDGFERWEMERKIRRLRARERRDGGSVVFTADECRGHFSAHDVRVLAAFASRCAELAEAMP